jgi:hypothetical protein
MEGLRLGNINVVGVESNLHRVPREMFVGF